MLHPAAPRVTSSVHARALPTSLRPLSNKHLVLPSQGLDLPTYLKKNPELNGKSMTNAPWIKSLELRVALVC